MEWMEGAFEVPNLAFVWRCRGKSRKSIVRTVGCSTQIKIGIFGIKNYVVTGTPV
jgi:hypothetical protein